MHSGKRDLSRIILSDNGRLEFIDVIEEVMKSARSRSLVPIYAVSKHVSLDYVLCI